MRIRGVGGVSAVAVGGNCDVELDDEGCGSDLTSPSSYRYCRCTMCVNADKTRDIVCIKEVAGAITTADDDDDDNDDDNDDDDFDDTDAAEKGLDKEEDLGDVDELDWVRDCAKSQGRWGEGGKAYVS